MTTDDPVAPTLTLRPRRTRIIWVIVLLALGVRLAWGLSRPAGDESLKALPDQVEYLTLARNLLHGQGLNFIDPRFAARVYAFRMPGFPLFVAALGANVTHVRIAQAILDALTVLAVYLLARLLAPTARRRMAIPAAIIVAVNPLLIYFSAAILTETLFIAMLMWGTVLLVKGIGSRKALPPDYRSRNDSSGGGVVESRSPNGRVLIWLPGAILLAASVLVRPSAALLPVVLGVGVLFLNRAGRFSYDSSPPARPLGRWPLPIATTMILLVALALLPWWLRNYRVFHQWVWLDTNSGITLYDGYNPDATGGSDQRFTQGMPQLRAMDERGRSEYLAIQASAYIHQHWRDLPMLALNKIGRTWSPMPLSDAFGSPADRAVLLLYAIPLDILVLGALWLGTLPRSVKVFLVLPAIYFTVVHGLTVGSLRYRLPAEPFLAILAASLLYSSMPERERADNNQIG